MIPSTSRCGPIWSRRDCRRSDAAVYNMSNIDLDPGEIGWLPGQIARPSVRLAGTGAVNGPTDVVASFNFVGTLLWAVAGEVVDRVGITSGWQYGAVFSTCRDAVYPSGTRQVTVLCSDWANTNGEAGDSGGPVFKLLDEASGQILFVGIHSGNQLSNPSSGIYSSLNQIRQDIPGVCFAYGC